MACLFSVDVEDWFHILDVPSAPALDRWATLPSRVEKNLRRLLEIFAERSVSVTCFFLGWIAEKYPHLVRQAQQAGHEIASHGYAHRLVYEMTEREFYDDTVRARKLLEDMTGGEIPGYRSSGFSATDTTRWFFDVLTRAGHHYDASVFPAPRGHGGMKSAPLSPFRIAGQSGGITEIPVTVAGFLGRPVCFFGGGYLRLFPYRLIKRMAAKVLDEGRPVTFYIHPREIDPGHPRLPMPAVRRFKSYVNLPSTGTKIRRLLRDFTFCTYAEYVRGLHLKPGRWP